MTIGISFSNILVYLLVWIRFAGMILFNPVLSRRNVPAMARQGLTLFLALMVAPLQMGAAAPQVYSMNIASFTFALIRELGVGFIYGFVFQIFYYFLFYIGDMMDQDIGVGMAKSFDPGTNIQTSFSSSTLTLVFTLYIFATGSHLALFRIFIESFKSIPVGAFKLNDQLIVFMLKLFISTFMLALRLMTPVMVAEFVLQASMGILMKFVPQITVFVINFQLRIFLGLIMLLTLAPYIGQFIDGYIDVMFNNLFNATNLMAGG